MSRVPRRPGAGPLEDFSGGATSHVPVGRRTGDRSDGQVDGQVDGRIDRGSRPLLGAFYMTLTAFLFAGLNGMVRYTADLGMHPFQIGFLRSVFALVVMLPFLYRTFAPGTFAGGLREGISHARPRVVWLYIARGVAATVGVLMWMSAISTLPLTEATAFSFTAPLLATAGSALILREAVGLRRWSAIVVGFLGVLVILRPGLVPFETGMIYAFAAVAGMASAAIIIKALTAYEPAARIVFFTSLMLTVTTALPAALVWVPMTPEFWLLGAGLGALGAVSHVTLTKSFEVADASAVLPFDYFRLPFAALVGWMWFAQTSDLVTWVGAAVIAGAAFYVANREQKLAKQGMGR